MTLDSPPSMTAMAGSVSSVPPSHWGDMRQHVFYGALYHWFVMFWNRGYRHFKPHRALTVSQEFRLYLKRLLLMIPTLFGVMLVTFLVTQFVPGGPVEQLVQPLTQDQQLLDHGPGQGHESSVPTLAWALTASAVTIIVYRMLFHQPLPDRLMPTAGGLLQVHQSALSTPRPL